MYRQQQIHRKEQPTFAKLGHYSNQGDTGPDQCDDSTYQSFASLPISSKLDHRQAPTPPMKCPAPSPLSTLTNFDDKETLEMSQNHYDQRSWVMYSRIVEARRQRARQLIKSVFNIDKYSVVLNRSHVEPSLLDWYSNGSVNAARYSDWRIVKSTSCVIAGENGDRYDEVDMIFDMEV